MWSDTRLIPTKNENTGGVTGWCLEIHDLIAGKSVQKALVDVPVIRLSGVILRQGIYTR